MYSLTYSHSSTTDLQSIYNYIAADNVKRATDYMQKLEKCILRLGDFPELGHSCKYDELKLLGIRVLPFDDYLIFYTINESEKAINILRVLHGSKNYRSLF